MRRSPFVSSCWRRCSAAALNMEMESEMNDKLIRQDIIDELDWDPSIDSANIGVAVHNGVATLTGHVPNYAQKFTAERAAQRVKSVRAVAGEIEVRFPGAVKHDDEQIADQAASVLSW